MRKNRAVPFKRFKNKDMFESVGQVILAANDMRNFKSRSSAQDAMWYVGMPLLRSRAKSSISAVILDCGPNTCPRTSQPVRHREEPES